MRYIVLILILLSTVLETFALDIVYPKKEKVSINGKTTFFVGSANPDTTLSINDNIVSVHQSGGFAHFVQLNHGVNKFVITSGDEVLEYQITSTWKAPEKRQKSEPAIIIYPTPKLFFTQNDKTPIRTTPVASGINRISHLEKDVPLYIDGELGKFYRVTLSDSEKYWVAKSDVISNDCCTCAKTMIISKNYKETNNNHIYTFNLSGKTPYIINENSDKDFKNGLGLNFYNTISKPNLPYELYFPIQHELFGYSSEFKDNKFILTIRKMPKISAKRPLKNITVTIDAGHGGNEKGAIGCLGDFEKDINLDVALKLQSILKSMGADVIMTRETDEKVSLKKRVEITNENNSIIFISIHANALPDNYNPLEHRGSSVYYYYPQAQKLAQSILISLNNEAKTLNDKVRQGSLAVVRNTNALSVLVELAYMINPEDNALLINDDFRTKCALAIAHGVENYLKTFAK